MASRLKWCSIILPIVLVFSVCLQSDVLAASILISAIYGEGSHFLAAAYIGEGLVKRGHHVTFLISNAYEHRVSDPRYSNMSFEVFDHPIPAQEVRDLFYHANTFVFQEGNVDYFSVVKAGATRMVDDCEAVVSNKDLMKRLERHDAILVDIAWPCARYMKAVFEEHLQSTRRRAMISLSATTPWVGLLRHVGSSVNYAYQPELTTGFPSRMTFTERTLNLIQTYLIYFVGQNVYLPLYQNIGEKLGLDPSIHPMFDMVDYDLHLLNIDFSSDFPFAMSPNIIPVGGLTARPADPLSEELEEFAQSSGEHGVVVFTLGTYLASITTIRPEIVVMFAEAFGKLPQNVFWQLKVLPDWELPSNVKAMPWLPQNDLLGHPKTRVFMFQGGNNGFQEASYHGVPLVVIPLQGDQYDVAARIVARGMGKMIDKMELNADIIYETLVEVINNSSYNTVAKQVSAINKDHPMRAPDRAAFWIEHVIKFGGSYMRSPAHELNFFQYHLIDVIAFLAAVLIVFLLVVFYILRCCLSLCCHILGRGSSAKTKRD